MTTQTRQEEIKAIHIKYEDFYRIAGGLVVILIFIMIGSWIFGQNAFDFEDNFLGYITNVATEALSVVGTVIVIDQLNRRRDREERKLELFDQAKSRSNDMAVDALEKIQRAGWWDELLEHYLDDYERSDLSQVQWAGGVNLIHKNLSGANLSYANLERANLWNANLKGAFLRGANLSRADLVAANLEGASLRDTNLSGAKLFYANLEGARLEGANLEGARLVAANLSGARLKYANLSEASLDEANLSGARLEDVNLEGARLEGANLSEADLAGANLSGAIINKTTKLDETTTLPDSQVIDYDEDGNRIFDKYWTPDTDMSRYTDPNHPDFWQPDLAKPDDTD